MNVGDKISWTKISKRGRVVNLRSLLGEIVAIDDEIVTIRNSNGRKVKVTLSELRPKDERAFLTEFVEAIFEANRDKKLSNEGGQT